MIRKISFLLLAFVLITSGLQAQNSSGGSAGECKVSFRAVLLQGAPNVVNFYTDSLFIDPATGVNPLWFWDFGDGETSTERNPVHTFSTFNPNGATFFTVTLTAVVGNYCTSSYTQDVYMGGYSPKSCTASFYWYLNDSIRFIMEGYAVQFYDLSWSNDSQVVEWFWDFGDGQTSTEKNPMHTYQPMNMSPLPPDFNVLLSIKTSDGCESKYSQLVTLKPVYQVECQAYFYYETVIDVVTIPEVIPVRFYDKSKGNVISRLWDFGDGTTSSEASPVHNYNFLEGQFVATLTITTDTGCVSSYSEYIRTGSSGGDCQPMFYYFNPDTLVSIPELVTYQFVDITESDIIKRSWDFGDGTWSNEKSPVHSYYFQGGAFVVTLTVVTSTGCENSNSQYIYVGGPVIEPVDTCMFYINVITGENPLTDGICNGTATASLFDYNGQQIDIDKFYWSNGDVGISTGNLCYNNYYSVKTMTSTGCGVYSDFTLYNGAYVDSGWFDPAIDWTTINDSLNYYFNYLVGLDSTWICVWDFGDGQTAEGTNVSHEYSDNGLYNVKLTIIDSSGVKVFIKAMEVNNVVSVKNKESVLNYAIYPNPVSDILNIKLISGKTGLSGISIIDITGKTMLSQNFDPGSSKNSIKISTRDLPPGMYFTKITRPGDSPVVLKFIK